MVSHDDEDRWKCDEKRWEKGKMCRNHNIALKNVAIGNWALWCDGLDMCTEETLSKFDSWEAPP